VLPGDTETSLSQRVLQQEHRIYPEAIRLFACGRLKCVDNTVWLDQHELKAPIQLEIGH